MSGLTRPAAYGWQTTRADGFPVVGFAQQIGINRSRAYELLKLHQYHDAVMTRCVEEETEAAEQDMEYRWPGWERAFSWFKPETPRDDTAALVRRSAELARELQDSKRREQELARQVERIKSARSVHHSSQSDEYRTPQAVFEHYDRIFHFDVDVAATRKNAKCERYFTKADDGLKQKWGKSNWLKSTVFLDSEVDAESI